MNSELTPREILAVEDTEEILQLRCPDTGIPLWAALRPLFVEIILSDLLYGVPIGGRETGTSINWKLRKLLSIPRSYAHNIRQLNSLKQEYPVVLMATGARMIKRDERFFNCLSDYFIDTAPRRTLAIEDLFDWKWPFPRHNGNVLLQTPLRVSGVLKGRPRAATFRKAANELVDFLRSRAETLLGWKMNEERRIRLTGFCMNGAASLLPRYIAYQKIFKKAGGRLLLKEESCYGGPDNISAIVAARHLGMATAEYQHGAVSAGHLAYNFAPAIINNPIYRDTLPDYFLAYGAWWAEQINVPSKKLFIGNPHRTAVLTGIPPHIGQCQQILVLGDGIETKLYLQLCQNLKNEVGNRFEIVFRPHPLERTAVRSKYPAGMAGDIRLDLHQDIYKSFQQAGVVVSEVSTGLFDAIGIVPKVFIWNTPKSRFAYSEHPFQGFTRVEELAILLSDDSSGKITNEQYESIWAPNWHNNYVEFIERTLPR